MHSSTNQRAISKSPNSLKPARKLSPESRIDKYKVSVRPSNSRGKPPVPVDPKGLRITSPIKKSKTQHRKVISSYLSTKKIPTDVQVKYSYFTKVGMHPENPKKVNQDSYFLIKDFANIPNCYLFGICDGHGQLGKEISNFIKDRFPVILANDTNLLNKTSEVIISSVQRLQAEILRLKLDTSYSGSTLNIVLIVNNLVYCANVGDSRAVLAKKRPKEWEAVALSKDHKPDVNEEKIRIESSGGRVEAYMDESGEFSGPARVWMCKLDYPGIAISRSLGDSVAGSIGVISIPDVTITQLEPFDKFIVIGSDGLFEFIQNEEIIRIASNHWKNKNPQAACLALVRASDERWRREEESIDDITCICAFIEVKY
jgi:serine/threonine protein phosphatase PrpC